MKPILIVIFIIAGLECYSQTDTGSFIPLAVGNVYVYNTEVWSRASPSHHAIYITRHEINQEMYANGKKYYFFTLFNDWVRYDESTKNLVKYSPGATCGNYPNEIVIDSLNANVNDSVKFCNGAASKKCTSKQIVPYYFQRELLSVGFNISSGYYFNGIQYCKGFGVTYFASGNSYPTIASSSVSIIKGCVISGLIYGDTLTTGTSGIGLSGAGYFGVNEDDRYIFESVQSKKKIFVSTFEFTTVSENKRYIYSSYYSAWVRYDTLSGCIVKTSNLLCGSPYYYTKVDSILARLHDTVKFCTGSPYKICTADSDTSILSYGVHKKTFTRRVNGKDLRETYANKFSLVSFDVVDSSGNIVTYNLKGAVVSGIVYGDTSSVYYTPPSTSHSYSYLMKQNYPNPFNPSTKIYFELKAAGFVSLKLYDLKGRLAANLLNETMPAGPFTFVLNSAEYNLPSGIYFYTLNTGDFKETKKMVLVK